MTFNPAPGTSAVTNAIARAVAAQQQQGPAMSVDSGHSEVLPLGGSGRTADFGPDQLESLIGRNGARPVSLAGF